MTPADKKYIDAMPLIAEYDESIKWLKAHYKEMPCFDFVAEMAHLISAQNRLLDAPAANVRPVVRWRTFDESVPCEGEEFLVTDGRNFWTDEIVCAEKTSGGECVWYLDSGNDITGALWWMPRPELPKTCGACNRFFAGENDGVGVCGKSGATVSRKGTCPEEAT